MRIEEEIQNIRIPDNTIMDVAKWLFNVLNILHKMVMPIEI